MVPFASIGVEPKLLELMEMSPTNKILYGSDGYNIPELFWFSGIHFRKCLGRVLSRLAEDEVISLSYAHQVARGILSENSKALYGL
jgi:predicted TIM-barrel fold metal-dependent hydrolase